jgi:hypothetical protein
MCLHTSSSNEVENINYSKSRKKEEDEVQEVML